MVCRAWEASGDECPGRLPEQVTTIGKCALKSFVGRVGEDRIHEIEKAVEVHLGLAGKARD